MSSSYYELLKHPNWQRKRLEIMQRAEFACEYCGATGETLNVHHAYYEKDLRPWEYPDSSLHCLCEKCHCKFQALYTELKRQLGRISLGAMQSLLGYSIGLRCLEDAEVEVDVPTHEIASAIAEVWGVREGDVIGYILGKSQQTITSRELNALREESGLRPFPV